MGKRDLKFLARLIGNERMYSLARREVIALNSSIDGVPKDPTFNHLGVVGYVQRTNNVECQIKLVTVVSPRK